MRKTCKVMEFMRGRDRATLSEIKMGCNLTTGTVSTIISRRIRAGELFRVAKATYSTDGTSKPYRGHQGTIAELLEGTPRTTTELMEATGQTKAATFACISEMRKVGFPIYSMRKDNEMMYVLVEPNND